jgi:hypothetical protein
MEPGWYWRLDALVRHSLDAQRLDGRARGVAFEDRPGCFVQWIFDRALSQVVVTEVGVSELDHLQIPALRALGFEPHDISELEGLVWLHATGPLGADKLAPLCAASLELYRPAPDTQLVAFAPASAVAHR